MNLSTQQLVITSLTAIALCTLLSLTIAILVANLHELEIFALYFNIISGVTGALAGLYMGKRLNDEDNYQDINNDMEDVSLTEF